MNGTGLEVTDTPVSQLNGTGDVDQPSNPGCVFYLFIIQTVLIGSFCVLGLIGNLTSFFVFQFDSLKTSTTFLFQSLCVTDTCLLICVFPLYSLQSFVIYTGQWISYLYTILPYVYIYVYPCSLVAQSATIWLTVLIGINRFIAVCVPYKAARWCTVYKAKQYVALVTLASILYNIPRFFVFEKSATKLAYTEFGDNKTYRIVYENICYLIFMLFLPLVILTVLNIRLIKTLKDIKRRRSEMQTRQQQQDNNVTLVLVVVVLVFCTCQIPPLINHILWSIYPDEFRSCMKFHWYLRPICNLLVVINSSTNFVIYVGFNTRFRSILMQRIFRVKCKQTGTATSNGASQTLLSKI